MTPREGRFVLENVETGKYVAKIPPEATVGSSYTRRLEDAQTFMTAAEALDWACSNERVAEISGLLQPPTPPRQEP